MGYLAKKHDNFGGLLPLILLFCLCGDGFDDILGDFDDLLPLLIILFCLCGNNGFGDILGDFDDLLPWIAVLCCCCFKR